MAPRTGQGSSVAQQKNVPDDLELLALGRWDVASPGTETADVRFATSGDELATMEIKWGPSARQSREYLLGRDDLWSLHEWLTKVLGLDEDDRGGGLWNSEDQA